MGRRESTHIASISIINMSFLLPITSGSTELSKSTKYFLMKQERLKNKFNLRLRIGVYYKRSTCKLSRPLINNHPSRIKNVTDWLTALGSTVCNQLTIRCMGVVAGGLVKLNHCRLQGTSLGTYVLCWENYFILSQIFITLNRILWEENIFS